MTDGSEHDRAFLLTAPGVSAIAVVRLAGPGVCAFLQKHFSAPSRLLHPVHGRLMDGDRELDDPVVVLDEQRRSADICTHGGTWVVQAVLELAQREGFQFVESTLPLPAVAVDAADELEREILQVLPMARTREAIQTLLNQRQAWSRPIAELKSTRGTIERDRSLHYLLNPPSIAIVGIPNAGKSTLANALFRQSRSIVADMPGTTRDYVEDFADVGGLAVRLVDTPGHRDEAEPVEERAIAISRQRIGLADLQILLLDPTQPREPQDRMTSAYPTALRVSGKADAARPWTQLAISAKTGEGLTELEFAIRRHFACDYLPHDRPCIWTDRQRRLLAE